MSIRFYCPLGHRLQVPDARAGKKGRCPLCYQKVIVPVADPRPSGRPKLGEGKEIILDEILAAELGIQPVGKSPIVSPARPGTPPLPSGGGSPVLPPPLPQITLPQIAQSRGPQSRSSESPAPPPVRRSKSDRSGRRRSGGSDSSLPPLPPMA